MRNSKGKALIFKGHAQLWGLDVMNGNCNNFSISIALYGLLLLYFGVGEATLGIEPRLLNMLSNYSTIELHS